MGPALPDELCSSALRFLFFFVSSLFGPRRERSTGRSASSPEDRSDPDAIETSASPVYYFPPGDVRADLLRPVARRTHCEFKGTAHYFDVVVGARAADAAAWVYPVPSARYTPICDHVAFYPHAMDACLVDGERARPQPGGFYGGWVTDDVVGPFKGGPGTEAW